ncbi:hypothetical protein BBJ28_00009717 [Nothophytophthora sp. Chile5]|nr:hypothetical protein BBJ28_00009717 [Nothophytophthora sp. Chile5]
MVRWLEEEVEEEKLAPMPPPPAPQAHPATHVLSPTSPPTRRPRRSAARESETAMGAAKDDEELLAPQTPPVPHTHPLVALANESRGSAQLPHNGGGMAIHSSQFHRRHPIVTGKRLDPTFLNRERIAAFVDRKENGSDAPSQRDAGEFAIETEHSSRAIALQLRRQAATAARQPVPPPLNSQEKSSAATEASARRHQLSLAIQRASMPHEEPDTENDSAAANGSALARASERKVPKQLDAKWIQARQDASNRPKGPLERPNEQALRETLFRTTAGELLRSGVLYDEKDAARSAAFESLSRPSLPMVTSGLVGLAGCCFESY